MALLTREYPPNVYGGAGVHVGYLARELARMVPVEVRRFRDSGGFEGPDSSESPAHLTVRAFDPAPGLDGPEPYRSALQTMSVDLQFAAGLDRAALVHSHTWYANLGGHLAKLAHGIPHVMTMHSLEPLRPWKAEQLGEGGYALSCFCERTAITAADAVLAVSGSMRDDILRVYPLLDADRVAVIHNGIDPDEYAPDPATDVLEAVGLDPNRASVVFVGRITRQKGIGHLLDAASGFDPGAQVILCAGSPDTEELHREVQEKIATLREQRDGVVWLDRILEQREVIQILSHATVFVCPSIYEPLGIVNLEAMACGVPVVASRVGGIPEVVEHGVTGYLVPFEPGDGQHGEPKDPRAFAEDLADRVNALLGDPATARRFGQEGRRRAVERFSWRSVAERVLELYRRLAPEVR
jgi:starch synthase